MNVRTRIAPSPTGYAHLGMISRILIDYALAKKNGGQFIWRNEDTDRDRFVGDSLEFNMKWAREFGFDWDEGPDKGGPYAPYTQTERLDLYKQASDKLIAKDYAYRCFCTKERLDELRAFQQDSHQQSHYDGLCRNLTEQEVQKKLDAGEKYTIRIKVPKNRIIEFTDAITHNHITWNSNDVDDYIIVKSNGIPTYHLAAMYDDIAMKITHAFRGSEWIATTPVHMLIFEGLEVKEEDRPKIGHFTVILDPNTPGKKFSKRNRAFRANGLVQQGYLKEAILNYLMLLGWAPKDNREIFTLAEFIEVFDLNGMQKSNPTWDQKKMDWFNGVYLRKLDNNQYVSKFKEWIDKYLLAATEEELIADFPTLTIDQINSELNFAKELLTANEELLSKQLALVQERAVSFWEAMQQIKFFYTKPSEIDLTIKQLDKVKEIYSELKNKFIEIFENFDNNSANWTHEDWEAKMRSIGDFYSQKHGDIFMALRVAIVGTPFSPPLFEVLQILGKEEVISRLKA